MSAPSGGGRTRGTPKERRGGIKPLRVLVAEDSMTVRKHLVGCLEAEGIEVVGEAVDGDQAVELCRQLRPDVVTMDMMMPGTDGLAATEAIMARSPTPILIVSSSTNRGEAFRTLDALSAGAVDVLEKPGPEDDGSWGSRLADRLRMVARIKVITHVRGLRRGGPVPAATLAMAPPISPDPEDREPRRSPVPVDLRCVVIGASTGGPAALVRLLGSLPGDFGVPVLVVLHLTAAFGPPFADWLGERLSRPVRIARDGEVLPPVGTLPAPVLLAPGDLHLELRGERLVLGKGPERFHCRPSVDVLFESAAEVLGGRLAACLLTGMGQDGARGLLAVRRVGGLTLAQDEASSVVFGMPGEAQRLGAASRMLAPEAMAEVLAAAVLGRRGSLP